MRRTVALSAALALAATMTGPTVAQDPMVGPTCMIGPAPIPPELAAWEIPVPLNAARSDAGLEQAQLTIGRRADLSLTPIAQVRFVVPPLGRARPSSGGGLVGFTIDRAGTYRIALGSDVDIDIIKGRRRAPVAAKAAGPECSGLRRTMDFVFTPGTYLLQVVNNPGTSLPILIVAL